MAKKIEFSETDSKNLALITAGAGAGVGSPFILRQMVDPLYPDGLPYVNTIVPWPWSNPSVFGSIAIGAASLIASIFIKPARYLLVPLGIGSLSVGCLFGAMAPPKELRSRPASRLVQQGSAARDAASRITLRSAGAGSPSSNFVQKSPQLRLQQLKKEAEDIELQKEVKKLEEENRFQRDRSSNAIPLRT